MASSLISRGIGAWSSISRLITRGLGIGDAAIANIPHASRVNIIAAESRFEQVRYENRVIIVANEVRLEVVR